MKEQEIIAVIKSGIFKVRTTKRCTRMYIDKWSLHSPVGLSVEGDMIEPSEIELSDGSFVCTDRFISSLNAMLQYATEHEAEAADEPSYDFIDVEPGEKSYDGGEYGFYTHFKATAVRGIYLLYTSCTCGFDSCGTGLIGLLFLTKEDVSSFYDPKKRFGNGGVGDGICYEWEYHLWKTPYIRL